MIEDAKRSIAFLCPVCRQPVILERTVFQLAASGSRLPCPCGKSALTVSLMGDQVRLTVPCLFCEQEHTVSCSTAAFLQEKTLAFSCANSGLVIPRGVRLSEAPSFGMPVIYYDKSCKGSQAYMTLAEEIVGKERG